MLLQGNTRRARCPRVRVHVPHRRRERECFGTRRRNYKLETFAFLSQNSQSSKYNGRSNISSSHSPEVHPQRSCELGGQGQGLVFRVFSQSVSYSISRSRPALTHLHRLSVRLRHSRSNTSTEYSFPGATVLFQISTADKTHVFIPCVCPVLVSVLFRFSRGHPAPRSFFGGTVHSGSLYAESVD